jgi:single-strand DNA-binding protein
MAGVNKVILLGRLGKDPEVRYTNSGTAITSFSMATSTSFTNKEGQKEEKTEWHKIVAFGRLGEICGEYLAKGKQVYIEGRIQTRDWEDKDGNKRWTTEIIVQNMQLLGSPGADKDRSSSSEPPPPFDEGAAGPPESDVPF